MMGWKYNPFTNQLDKVDCPNRFTEIDFSDSPYQALVSDDIILVDATNGNIIINLYTRVESKEIRIKKIDASVNEVTINGDIDGESNSIISTQYVVEHLIAQPDEWGHY